ncbi:MAG TPA: TetR family transcriptional regulator [Dermatophilaceae bacterium]|nr:TetR family transcriptional regulator [Dermatophilaceae bacterium]
MTFLLPKAPDPRPRPGLRERKRAAAIRHIQSVALDLFDRDGFDRVTVEQVAEAAEVSPSSIYRYFATKEGLIVHDEFDAPILAAVRRHLADHDVIAALELALEEVGVTHLVDDGGLSLRRMPYLLHVPSVRSEVFLAVDDAVALLADELATPGRRPSRDPVVARAVAAAAIWAIIGAMTAWYTGGTRGSVLDAVSAGLASLRCLDESSQQPAGTTLEPRGASCRGTRR